MSRSFLMISRIKSELDIINGIGEKTKLKLLKKFKSISNIKKHSFDEVSSEIEPPFILIIIDIGIFLKI